MQKLILSFLLCVIGCLISSHSNAQLWKRIKNEVQTRVENRAVKESGNTADKVVDKAEKKAADALTENKQGSGSPGETATAPHTSSDAYKSYDFVPGDKIIFEPDLGDEPDAELPARFTIKHGNAEIQTFEGEKVLHLQADGSATIAPLMKPDNYLPEQFTLEFDMLYENEGSYFAYVSDFRVAFRASGDQGYYNNGLYAFTIYNTKQCSFGKTGKQNIPARLQPSFGEGNTWHHIAIYVHKNIGKAYIDGYRVCATNTLPPGASGFDIKADRYGIKIKNMRLAAGGEDKYNKVVTDGKFITHGILFDVNKASIKAESMGVLNEIVKLMKDHTDLKFEIDGHTDSDGAAAANLELSRQRAAAVKSKLVEMGIEESRLTTKGYGATQPIDTNNTAEGKANNRRVEFVKI